MDNNNDQTPVEVKEEVAAVPETVVTKADSKLDLFKQRKIQIIIATVVALVLLGIIVALAVGSGSDDTETVDSTATQAEEQSAESEDPDVIQSTEDLESAIESINNIEVDDARLDELEALGN